MIDGKSLLRELRGLLSESSTSDFMDDRMSYSYLHKAATEFVDRTDAIKVEQSITTVASTAGYTLNADFLKLYIKNRDNDYFIKYNDGTNDTLITIKDYNQIIYDNQTDNATIPSYFSIINDSTNDSQISSTATAVGAASGGVCTLTDSTAPFADVSAGDIVHNITDGSDGIVVSKTSSSALVTALFDGTNNDWTSADSYVIQPQSRMKLILSPPPSTSGHTVTLYYIQKPVPVYSSYGIYQIPSQYLSALVFYAAWLYKYSDREPNFGDALYAFFDKECRKASPVLNTASGKSLVNVSFKKRFR